VERAIANLREPLKDSNARHHWGMRSAELTNDTTAFRFLIPEFEIELERIVKEHRYIVRTARREFEGLWNHYMSQPGDGELDGGDIFALVEAKLGINPFDVEGDAGLAAISRAVSLAEVTFARIAAAHFHQPGDWVYIDDQLWTRELEAKFFKSVLRMPVNTSANGFGSLRALRDLYAHGYGVPATAARRDKLAARLYSDFPANGPSFDERLLGYRGDAYWFGKYTSFDTKTSSLVSEILSSKNADVSELAAYRALRSIESHVQAVEQAVINGVHTNLSDTNAFLKAAERRRNRKAFPKG
jgi:hypothetical protein